MWKPFLKPGPFRFTIKCYFVISKYFKHYSNHYNIVVKIIVAMSAIFQDNSLAHNVHRVMHLLAEFKIIIIDAFFFFYSSYNYKYYYVN